MSEVENNENENNQEEPSFAQLLEESEARTVTRVRTGQKMSGRVIQRDRDMIHIDIGMRSEAIIKDMDDERVVALKEGDELDVFVIKAGYQVVVGLDPVLGTGDISVLIDAYAAKKPVSGRIEATNSGGYSVNIAGVRCFCPHSQIDMRRQENPDAWIGRTEDFAIIECDEQSRNVVLSRRRIQEEVLEKQIAETRAQIVSGAQLQGRVHDIRPYGAFIDLGGIHGLLHISELSHQHVDRVEDVLNIGQEIDVEILDVTQDDRGRDRISLSRKTLLPDPWNALELEKGAILAGRIAKIREFGIFVEVTAGVQGLIPLRFLRYEGRLADLDQFDEGQELEVEIVDWDDSSHQITLAIPGWDNVVRSDLKPGDQLTARVVKHVPAGLIVEGVDDPARGLLPKRLLDQTSHKQIEQLFPVGSEHRVVIEGIDERGRYSFSILNEKEAVERTLVDEYTTSDRSIGHNPFASFFDEPEDD